MRDLCAYVTSTTTLLLIRRSTHLTAHATTADAHALTKRRSKLVSIVLVCIRSSRVISHIILKGFVPVRFIDMLISSDDAYFIEYFMMLVYVVAMGQQQIYQTLMSHICFESVGMCFHVIIS